MRRIGLEGGVEKVEGKYERVRLKVTKMHRIHV